MASNRDRGRLSNRAMEEQMRQVLTDMQTAAQIWKNTGQELQDNLGGPGMSGIRSNQRSPYAGGSPRSMGNQTQRPQHYGHGYPGSSLGQMRSIARTQVAGQMQSRYGGNYKPVEWDASGKPTLYDQLDNSGKSIPNSTVHHSEIQRQLLVNRLAAGVEGGGMLGAVRAAPVMGTAAMAVGAVYEGAKFISAQRAANAQYQSILGGSNMAGLGQRLDAEGYKLGQLFSGGLSGKQADAAFKGVTALGYQGGQRQQRLDFVSQNYRSMGMSPDESLKLINIAAQTTTTSLADLQKQLKGVSDMAKETSQNASALRGAFTANFQSLAQAGAGGGAGLIAQAQLGLTAGAGRQYANVDLSGLQSASSQLLQANQLGMTLGQYYAANTTDNGMTFARGQQAQLNWAVQSAGGGTNVMNQIQAEIQKEGGAGKVSGDVGAQQRIAQRLMASGALDPLAIGNILSSLSVDVSKIAGGLPGQAAYLVMLVAKGGGSLTSQVAAGQGAGARTAMSDSAYAALRKSTHVGAHGLAGRASGLSGEVDSSNIVQRWEMDTRTSDPALEKVYGVSGDKTKLQFFDGKTALLKDALKNSDYVSQIDQGTAIIESGDSTTKGFTVAQKGWSSVGAQAGQANGDGTSSPAGAVSVQVNMSNDARQLLSKLGIVITGNTAVETGARGVAPTKPSTGPSN